GHVSCVTGNREALRTKRISRPIWDMTGPPSPVEPEFHPRLGLRLRLWFAALAGVVAGIGGLTWALWGLWPTIEETLGGALGLRLMIVGAASLFVALACALWLEHGLVRRVRRLVPRWRADRP